jgi:hypothetical protein
MTTETRESIVGRRILECFARRNRRRQEEKAAVRAVIAAIRQSWRGVRQPTGRQVRERWIELAPDIRPPSLRSIHDHLRALRRM